MVNGVMAPLANLRAQCAGSCLIFKHGAHVVRCVRGPCCGTCSGPMLWDVFGAHVVGRVRGPWCGTCPGPMLWDVFGAHVVGQVRGLWHDHDVEMGEHIEFV